MKAGSAGLNLVSDEEAAHHHLSFAFPAPLLMFRLTFFFTKFLLR